MGIKVTCPNGHRLVVKDELGGKRGVCPKCNQPFQIPLAGDAAGTTTASPQPGAKGPAPSAAPQPGNKAAPQPKPTPAPSAPQPKSTPQRAPSNKPAAPSARPQPVGTSASTAPATGKPEARSPGERAKAPTPQPSGPPGPPNPPSAGEHPAPSNGAATVDPIAESPQTAWYVRHPNGAQYGPAKGELMRQWLAEGRVGADSLTWCEGWTEWRRADEVFVELAASKPVSAAPSTTSHATASMSAAGPAAVSGMPRMPVAAEETGAEAVIRSRALRRKKQKMRLIISGVLLLVIITLAVILAIVLTNN